MSDVSHFGPLAHLTGEWAGDKGLDVSYHHAEGETGDTPYRETITFKPFGPVDNGTQVLFGLDYKMAAWRVGEEDPFHTEVGYWLWDGGHIVHARAAADSDEYGICSNPYLYSSARCIAYDLNLSVDGDILTYDETTTLQMKEFEEPYVHTDANTLRRTASYELPPAG